LKSKDIAKADFPSIIGDSVETDRFAPCIRKDSVSGVTHGRAGGLQNLFLQKKLIDGY
jgi:hypothetical protein